MGTENTQHIDRPPSQERSDHQGCSSPVRIEGPRPDHLLPAALQGYQCMSMCPKRNRICFDYNQGHCPRGAFQCARGLHMCMKCFQHHRFLTQCPQGPMKIIKRA